MDEIKSIPKEKFEFAEAQDFTHERELTTKPVGYLRDAFRRFCKNKGSVVAACIIIALILFAIIAPLCSAYTVDYSDAYYTFTRPKSKIFASTSFWDGCSEETMNEEAFRRLYAMGLETGHNAVKNQEYEIIESDGNKMYRFRMDSYHKNGMVYMRLNNDEYLRLQAYQSETGKQVLYPTIRKKDRPEAVQDQTDANYYYKTKRYKGKTQTVYDENGNIIPVYKSHAVGGTRIDKYESIRIPEPEGIEYEYAIPVDTGWEVRVNYYEYYIYYHSYVLKDGIKEPSFLFGTTATGQDVFTALASGARFSFIFSIIVASVNLFVGAIYGAIEGYYGGKVDLIMERISDILAAVPFMIVITLLQLYMGSSSQMLILFIAFFLTGWLSIASRTRMQFYRYKNQEYVLAARTLGARDGRLMFKHIFPNALGTLITGSVLVIPGMIYSETNLSYLGIINLSSGNLTSVGTLLASGQPYLSTFPHIILFPSIFLALLMLSFNLFGNGLRDAFNPSLRGSD